MSKFHVITCVRNRACSIHLMFLDIEIRWGDYLSLSLFHGGNYMCYAFLNAMGIEEDISRIE